MVDGNKNYLDNFYMDNLLLFSMCPQELIVISECLGHFIVRNSDYGLIFY